VGALIIRRGRVLLAERGHEPLKGVWSLPGGVVEVGETLETAIRREVREETGLEVKVTRLFEIFERIMPDEKGRSEYHYVLLDYLCRPAGGALAAGDDVSRVEWVAEGDLKEYDITEGTKAVIRRAFRATRKS
jgi:mutator protein MutT